MNVHVIHIYAAHCSNVNKVQENEWETIIEIKKDYE